MMKRTFGTMVVLIATLFVLPSRLSADQTVSTDSMVNCPAILQPEPLTPYGFAKANLVSLYYARNAGQSSDEIKQAAKDATNSLAWMTALMRITKTATNNFICAKRSIKPFAVDESGDAIKTAASFLLDVYDQHIAINQRLLELIKKTDTVSQVEMSDELSTMQVDRDQRWADLVKPTTLALLSLEDSSGDQSAKIDRLVITKAQKLALIDWANEHFPELKDGTPEVKWADPAKTAQMYFLFFNNRNWKCSDEK
jgi:hypothetical protein